MWDICKLAIWLSIFTMSYVLQYCLHIIALSVFCWIFDVNRVSITVYSSHIFASFWLPWGPARGGPMSPVWILKHLVSVFINTCRLLPALPSLSQFGRGRLSLVAISFYALSLLFGPCRLSEFTLAGPLPLFISYLSSLKTESLDDAIIQFWLD